MSKALSFIKFQPQQFTKVWGGEKLHKFYGKPIGSQIGESWEISGVKGKVSELQAGFGQAHNLTELIAACGTDLLGARVYNNITVNFHCSLSSSMLSKIYPFNFIPMTL